MVDETSALKWLTEQSEGRARPSASAEETLTFASTVADLGLMATLGVAKRSLAISEIALSASLAIRDSRVPDQLKLEFIGRIGKLLGDVVQAAVDARLQFWELLLAPNTETAISDAVRVALTDSLIEQLGSANEICQWSAARGIAALSPIFVAALREEHPILFSDPAVRKLLSPAKAQRANGDQRR